MVEYIKSYLKYLIEVYDFFLIEDKIKKLCIINPLMQAHSLVSNENNGNNRTNQISFLNLCT